MPWQKQNNNMDMPMQMPRLSSIVVAPRDARSGSFVTIFVTAASTAGRSLMPLTC